MIEMVKWHLLPFVMGIKILNLIQFVDLAQILTELQLVTHVSRSHFGLDLQ